jgi:hypothetical protein
MRATLYLSIVAFVQLFAVSMAQEKPATAISPGSASTATYITRVTVVDTVTGKEAPEQTVVITGDRISMVVTARASNLRSARTSWTARANT